MVTLTLGWNGVTYTGPSQPVAQAVASIINQLIIIWSLQGGVWYWYDPDDPGSNLDTLEPGDEIDIQVSEDVDWDWNIPWYKSPIVKVGAVGALVLGIVLLRRK